MMMHQIAIASARRTCRLERPVRDLYRRKFRSIPSCACKTASSLPLLHAASSCSFGGACRHLSSGDGINGKSSGNDGIVDSTAATTQWKRSHYRKIEDKFQSQEDQNKVSENNDKQSSTQQLKPLTIDKDEDVQPMWREMESRVTKRRSLTLEQRGGVSGRRNVRKSDEDVWLAAGVYDSDEEKGKK